MTQMTICSTVFNNYQSMILN